MHRAFYIGFLCTAIGFVLGSAFTLLILTGGSLDWAYYWRVYQLPVSMIALCVMLVLFYGVGVAVYSRRSVRR